jgi:predicted PurR-regulated permease PerM
MESTESAVETNSGDTPDKDAANTDAAKPDLSLLGEYLRGTRGISSIATWGIFCLGSVAFLYLARPFCLPVVLALMLSFLLKPLVRYLARIHVPSSIGAALVLAVVLGILGSGVSQVREPAGEWLTKVPEGLRKVELKIRHLFRPAAFIPPITEPVPKTDKDSEAEDTQIKSVNLAGPILSFTTSFVTGAIETFVLLYFLLAAGDLFLLKLVKVLPSLQDKKRAVEIAHEVEEHVSTFLSTITAINICLGVVVGFAMYFLGVPNPVLWGAMATVFNFIPYFGPIAAATLLALAGSLTFEGWGRPLLPALVYLSLHGIESNFVTPTILGRRLTLNPVVIFVSLIFWSWVWGVAGALLAVPLLMTVKIVCDHFEPLQPIAEFLSG